MCGTMAISCIEMEKIYECILTVFEVETVFTQSSDVLNKTWEKK